MTSQCRGRNTGAPISASHVLLWYRKGQVCAGSIRMSDEGQVRQLSTNWGSRTQLEEGNWPRCLPFCPMLEPGVIENTGATKQDASGKAFIQVSFH